jgi:dTDP-L-rhamnose 4-epimerase
MFLCVGRAYGIPTTALRYFNVYGPRQALSNPYTGAAAIFCARFLSGHAPLIFEDGLQTRDFVHVQDIIQANLLALDRPEADFGVFNVGTGRQTSVLDLAKVIGKALGSPKEPQISGQFREGDIRHCFADISKIRQTLGYKASVSLEEGLGNLVPQISEQLVQDQVDQATAELARKRLVW